jgi:hypothetical protein
VVYGVRVHCSGILLAVRATSFQSQVYRSGEMDRVCGPKGRPSGSIFDHWKPKSQASLPNRNRFAKIGSGMFLAMPSAGLEQ